MTDTGQKQSFSNQLQKLDIFKCYEASKYLSIKHSSYFQVYQELLSKYRHQKITFVEIGVLNGGSLFMWRQFFGPEARIIGIDFNPIAKRWEADGFEIHIGSQSDSNFWDKFFSFIGDVDVILDDGGHTNEQQIITASKCIPHIKNGGMLVAEDVHASYMATFHNPSKYSFINYSKHLIDSINSRFPLIKSSSNPLAKEIYSVSFYESIVCFNIDREKCFSSTTTSNNGISLEAKDYRHEDSKLEHVATVRQLLSAKLNAFKHLKQAKSAARWIFDSIDSLHRRIKAHRLKRFFT